MYSLSLNVLAWVKYARCLLQGDVWIVTSLKISFEMLEIWGTKCLADNIFLRNDGVTNVAENKLNYLLEVELAANVTLEVFVNSSIFWKNAILWPWVLNLYMMEDAHNVEKTLKICTKNHATNLKPNILEILVGSDIYKSSSMLFYKFGGDFLAQTISRNLHEPMLKLPKVEMKVF